jgi:hypothetical protein
MIKDVIIHYIDISEPLGLTTRNGHEIQVRLGVPEDHLSLKNAPEFDYSPFYAKTVAVGPTALWYRFAVSSWRVLAQPPTRRQSSLSYLKFRYSELLIPTDSRSR